MTRPHVRAGQVLINIEKTSPLAARFALPGRRFSFCLGSRANRNSFLISRAGACGTEITVAITAEIFTFESARRWGSEVHLGN